MRHDGVKESLFCQLYMLMKWLFVFWCKGVREVGLNKMSLESLRMSLRFVGEQKNRLGQLSAFDLQDKGSVLKSDVIPWSHQDGGNVWI